MFYKIKIPGICLFFAVLWVMGCSSKEDTTPEEPAEWPLGQDVYVAGVENTQNNIVARLWKNGTVENLTGSTVKSSGEITTGTEARSVFVSGADVYVAGYEMTLEGDEMIVRARLWKNGLMQNLANGTYSDHAFAVFVSDGDVYVLGREALEPSTFPSRWAFKLWKNGEAEIFATGNSRWQVNSLFVSHGNVYVAGCTYDHDVQQARIWINGVAEDLTVGTGNSNALSVFVSGSDVYVAGFDHVDPGNSSVAKLWKNGKPINLSDGKKNAKAYAVCIADNDVYVAGVDGEESKLWKNGVAQDIADAGNAILLHAVCVKNNDIYLAGYVEGLQEVAPGSGIIPVSYLKASLWRNGKKLDLSVGKYFDSKAFSVFVN